MANLHSFAEGLAAGVKRLGQNGSALGWFKGFSMTLFNQIATAVLLLILTLWLQCAGVAGLIEWLKRVLTRDTHDFGPLHAAALVVKSSVAVIVLHGLVILLWASWYRLRCFSSWELAFYFSSGTYTTLGSGDVTLPSNWRLLGPLESMTGVLMCGVSVAVLFAIVTRSIAIHERRKKSGALKTPDLRSSHIRNFVPPSKEYSHD